MSEMATEKSLTMVEDESAKFFASGEEVEYSSDVDEFPLGFTEDDREKLDVVYAFCKGMADMMEQVQSNPMAKNMLTSMGMSVGRFANGR